MGICGCQSGCGCVIQGADGITVGGSGSLGNPMIIALDPTVGQGCNRIMDCVGGHIGNGLDFNAGTRNIAAKIDPQPGNTTVIGANGGLFTAGCVGCGSMMTVDQLPASGVLEGNVGTGEWTSVAWSRMMVTLGLAYADMPFVFNVSPITMADGSLWWMRDPTVFNQNWNENAWVSNTLLAQGYGQQLNMVPYGMGGSANPAAYSYCGSGNYISEGPLPINELLTLLGGRAIIRFWYNPGLTPAGRARLETMVQRLGLVKSVIMTGLTTGAEYTALKNWALLGGFSQVYIPSQAISDATLPGTLTADGIKGVIQDRVVTDAGFTKFQSAGQPTILSAAPPANATGGIPGQFLGQNEGNRVVALGLRGYHGGDPFFGGAPAVGNTLRTNQSPFRLARPWHGMYSGSGTALAPNLSCTTRGDFVMDPAPPNLPSPDTWYRMQAGVNNTDAEWTLQGWAAFGPTTSYVLTGHMRFSPVPPSNPSQQWIGIGFSTTRTNGFPSNGAATYDGYVLRIDGAGTATLARLDVGGLVTLGAPIAGIPVTGELVWRITVTATTITAAIGPTTPSNTIGPITDATYRGGYLYTLRKHNSAAGGGTWDALFRNFLYTP